MKRISALGIAICLIGAGIARGDIPGKADIDRDLAGEFAAAQARPELAKAGELSLRVENFAIRQARYQVSLLKPWKEDPRALLLTGGEHIEAGIRPNGHTIFGLAVMARCFDASKAEFAAELSPEIAKEKAIAMLRFVAYTHGAGGKMCSDGKQWKDQWQSAYWAAITARGAWLLWDDLDLELKWVTARMICDEADRFIGRPLDHQVVSDTKAEENAWNSQAVAMAFNMFPKHPHHAVWGETANKWQISSFMTSQDAKSDQVVDGKPLKEWSPFPNIYDDYTLENHDRVHPDYMTAMTLNLHQVLDYDWGGNPRPAALTFNTDKIYASLKTMAFPDGGWIYPNGQDWHLHRNSDWTDAHIDMAVLFNDPVAARMARICLTTAEKMIGRYPGGGVYAPGETIFASSQGLALTWAAHAYLMMAAQGEGPAPIPEDQLWKQSAGNRTFRFGRFSVARTDHSIATFSYGRQIMGMVMPLRKDLLCTPNTHGLIGYVDVDGVKNEAPTVIEGVGGGVLNSAEQLTVCLALNRGKGAIEQRIAFVALADGRVIYVDSCRITGKVPRSVELGTLGILNDKNWVYGDGRRTLAYDGGKTLFQAWRADSDPTFEASHPWYNLDGMGIVVLSSGKQIYLPKPTKAAGRLEQFFHLNHPASPGELKPTVVVFYPGQMAEETPGVAGKVKLDSADDRHFTITLDDGKMISTDLDQLSIKVQ